MLERTVEAQCLREAERRGGVAKKLVPVGEGGFPDRTILVPTAQIGFLELKRPGEKPEPLQWWWIKTLRRLGFLADYADSPERVRAIFVEWFGACE